MSNASVDETVTLSIPYRNALPGLQEVIWTDADFLPTYLYPSQSSASSSSSHTSASSFPHSSTHSLHTLVLMTNSDTILTTTDLCDDNNGNDGSTLLKPTATIKRPVWLRQIENLTDPNFNRNTLKKMIAKISLTDKNLSSKNTENLYGRAL